MSFRFTRRGLPNQTARSSTSLLPASALLVIALTGCEPQSPANTDTTPTANTSTDRVAVASEKLSLQALATAKEWAIDAAQLLPATGDWQGLARIAASPRQGLLLLADDGTVRGQQQGRFDTLDSRDNADGSLWLASYDRVKHQPVVLRLRASEPHFSAPLYLPAMDFGVESVCLYRDADQNLQLFVVGEEGRGEHWLVGHDDQLLATAKPLRQLSLPPSAKFCAVDDQNGDLFVNEEGIGVWRYPAAAETDPVRDIIALVAPHGPLGSADGLAAENGTVLIVDGDNAQLRRYQRDHAQWQALPSLALTDSQQPEQISARISGAQLHLLIRDDETDQFSRTELDWTPTTATAALATDVPARLQTEAVISEGDAADDPAIWQHPTDRSKSRVLATDKKYGLLVYDLDGKQLQALPSGDINNVDIRSGFQWQGKTIDLAVAGNRSFNSLTVYGIDRTSGLVSELANLPVPMQEIYGLCLYSPQAGEIHAIPNDKTGRFLQYRLQESDGKLNHALLREFKLGSQPEACVADDRNRQLYVGEEDVAVWTLAADAMAATTMTEVIRAGAGVEADIEGLGLWQNDRHSYLVISSQGDDSYVVLDATSPYRVRGRFRVGLNAKLGIDGVSETDGLEVSSSNFGGAFSEGLLVLQDGRKRLPQGRQNFKYVAWADVRTALKLD